MLRKLVLILVVLWLISFSCCPPQVLPARIEIHNRSGQLFLSASLEFLLYQDDLLWIQIKEDSIPITLSSTPIPRK